MKVKDILLHRLYHQQIAETSFTKPEEIVSWLIAMQSQEYAQAKWAIGLRIPGLQDADIEQAFNEGRILRTHIMRPTWHFVAPEDIRWLQMLTAAKVRAQLNHYLKKESLDAKLLTKAEKVIIKALEGGRFATRKDLQVALAEKQIVKEGPALSFIMIHAELECLICSGPREGKQFTYALLDERAAPAKTLTREEALATFALRYFTSRGPASVHDLAYWSGLTIKDAKEGASHLPENFQRSTFNGREYFYLPIDASKKIKNATFIMPDYDEYGMSYQDREAFYPKDGTHAFDHSFVIDGEIAGSWKKGEKKGIVLTPFEALSAAKQKALDKAEARYLAFMG